MTRATSDERRRAERGLFGSVAPARIAGKPGHRVMLGIYAAGCAYALTGPGPCTYCAFPLASSRGELVPAEKLREQVRALVAEAGPAARLARQADVYNSGSFFCDEEIDAAGRDAILDELLGCLPEITHILVESRPEYVTPERLARARDRIGARTLIVGVGFETLRDTLRNDALKKGMTREEVETLLATLAAGGAEALAYVLIKPPGLSERAAIDEAVATARWCFDAAARARVPVTVALQPVFVQEGTAVHVEARRGRYRPPWLWSVIEVVERVASLGDVQVGTSNDDPPPYDHRRNCGACDARVEAAIARFVQDADTTAFTGLDCACRAEWQRALDEPSCAAEGR